AIAAASAPQASLTVSRQPPDSDSHSVKREEAQAGAGCNVKWGAIAAASAPQASLTVSRQHSASPPLRGTQRSSVKTGAAQLAHRAQTVLA
ncbi:MAG: hypothetical protein ACREUY_08145, partial [Burkholderiales bacterium]